MRISDFKRVSDAMINSWQKRNNSLLLYHMAHIVQENIPLGQYSVFKIGGPARFFSVVKNKDEMMTALRFAKEKNTPFFMLGAGSNILVADAGFEGLVIKNELNGISSDEKTCMIYADAGISMPRLAAEAAKNSIAGFAWAIGIPGTVGGSIRGNAGAFGKETKDVLVSAKVYDAAAAAIKQFNNASCRFGYRDSVFKHNSNLVVLSAEFRGSTGDQEEIRKKIREITEIRSKTQDIGAKCAGCVFKNVAWRQMAKNKEQMVREFPDLVQFQDRETIPAGYLIDRAGLKGARIGNTEISQAHANYIINEGGATADEVVRLVARVKEQVRLIYGIALEEEIQYVGF